MQLSILLFFQNISSPFLDKLAQFITMFGEETLFIVFIVLFLWCFSKKRGFVIFSNLFSALIGMSVLKAIVKYPRPFQVSPDIAAKRLATATGYSFPSGHSTGAASFYSALALSYKKRALSILAALMILLVGLSRLYLGVHWPLDVFGGWALGIGISFFLNDKIEKLYEKETSLSKFSIYIAIIASTLSLISAILITFNISDSVAFSDPTKLFALAGGGYFGFALERKFVNYKTEGSLLAKIIRFIVGLVVILALQALKAVLGPSILIAFIRYWLIGIWATYLFPALGSKVKINKSEKLF